MNNIVITDIFNNKIYNNLDINKIPFIIIHTNKPHLILEKISTISDTNSIWKLIKPTIKSILFINKIDPKNFSSLGDIWIPSHTLPNKIEILLVNTNISTYPIDYIKTENQNTWKPIAPKGFKEIGLITSIDKPLLNELSVVNINYLIPYDGPNNNILRNTNMNEFNLLANIESQKYTVNKKLLNKIGDNLWKTYKGKKLMLIEPNIPWYISKEKEIPQPINISTTKIIHEQINVNVIISSLSLVVLLLIITTNFLDTEN